MSPLSPRFPSPGNASDSSDAYVRPSSRQRFRRPSATIIAMPDTDLGLGSPGPSESTGAILLSPLTSPSGSYRGSSPAFFRPSELSREISSAPLGAHPCEAEDEEADSRSSSPRMAHPLARSRTLERMLSIESSVAGSEMYRRDSNGSASEATPLLAEGRTGKWYHGPVFASGVKLCILFAGFSAVLLGTFWFGMPTVDP